MNRFYVYVYYIPVTMQPFYVGKGSGSRYLGHLKLCLVKQSTHFYNKLFKMLNTDNLPIIKIFKDNLTEQEAFELEKTLIKHWGRVDLKTGCLCNHTDGGDSGCSHTPEHNAKIGNSIFGKKRSYDTLINMSKPRSEEAKIKIRQFAATRARKICCVNYKGEVVRIFESIGEAARCGYSLSSINRVLNGSRTAHRGYFWRDAQESDVPLLVD